MYKVRTNFSRFI